MTSEFSEIISRFLSKVTDFELPKIEKSLANEMISSWLHTTLSRPYVRRLFKTFSIDDDVQEINYTLKNPSSDDEDREFIEEMFAEGLVVAWLRPQYRSTLNTRQGFFNDKQKYYSQAAHAASVGDIYKEAEVGLRKMIRDRDTLYNGYLKDD